MTSYQVGVALGLCVACAWTGSSIAFSAASRRVGSVPVNLIRLIVALILLSLLSWLARGQALPTDATPYQAGWLVASGVAGFFIGDLTLFRAFVLIGPRRATLIMSLAPAFAAITSRFVFGEVLSAQQIAGMLLTLVGVMWVVVERQPTPAAPLTATSTTAPPTDDVDAASPQAHARSSLRKGVLLGVIGAMGQGVGAVLTKHAFAHGALHALASTQIRAGAAVPLFVLFVIVTGRSKHVVDALRDARGMVLLTIGAIAGPVAGVSMFNASVARVPSGVTSVLAGLVPVVMLPVAALALREHVSRRAVFGALVAIAGVVLLALA